MALYLRIPCFSMFGSVREVYALFQQSQGQILHWMSKLQFTSDTTVSVQVALGQSEEEHSYMISFFHWIHFECALPVQLQAHAPSTVVYHSTGFQKTACVGKGQRCVQRLNKRRIKSISSPISSCMCPARRGSSQNMSWVRHAQGKSVNPQKMVLLSSAMLQMTAGVVEHCPPGLPWLLSSCTLSGCETIRVTQEWAH